MGTHKRNNQSDLLHMSTIPPTSSLQAYNLLVFRAALHPEFFNIRNRKRIAYGDYEFEAWVFNGGHSLRFESDGLTLSEVVTDAWEGLPDRGLVTNLPCAGERDHEAEFCDRLVYMTSMQTETLTDHLYLATYNELLDHAQQCGDSAILSRWDDDQNNNLSLLDLQRYRDEVHIQCYHLRGDCGLVLRTQSIFQINDVK